MADNHRKANAAPRCAYIRMNDQPCRQPALQGNIFCRFHDLVEHPLPAALIPFVEDATSLQVAIMQVIRSMQLGKIERHMGGTILYALQLAASNLKHFCEENGHPFAEPARRLTKEEQREEELSKQPSLAEYLIKALELEPPPQEQQERVMQQASALSNPPVVHRDDAKQTPPCSSVPTVVKTNSGVVDDLKACVEPRKHAGSSTRMRRARKTGAPYAVSSLGMTPVEVRECEIALC